MTIPQRVAEPALASAALHYRHVNQAERWQRLEMQQSGQIFSAGIPAEYTESPFALEYRFELRLKSGAAWFAPGLNAALSSQPYYAVTLANA
jgi:hypothetical protein